MEDGPQLTERPTARYRAPTRSLSTQVLRQNTIVVLNQRLVPGRYRVVAFHQCSIEHELLDLGLKRQDDFAYALGVVRGRDEEPRAAGGLVFVPPPLSGSSGSK